MSDENANKAPKHHHDGKQTTDHVAFLGIYGSPGTNPCPAEKSPPPSTPPAPAANTPAAAPTTNAGPSAGPSGPSSAGTDAPSNPM